MFKERYFRELRVWRPFPKEDKAESPILSFLRNQRKLDGDIEPRKRQREVLKRSKIMKALAQIGQAIL